MQLLHSHKHKQCYYIISGNRLLIVDRQSKKAKEDDAVFNLLTSTRKI
jgi:mannose-6-phosphate isomerase-like protein (cupin superfamily)